MSDRVFERTQAIRQIRLSDLESVVNNDKIKNMAQATDLDELTKILEALVRKVVREELANFARENGMIYLSPDSPLYEDMEKILQRRLNEEPKLYDHAEVWG